MKKPSHILFNLPGSLFWLLPLFSFVVLFWKTDSINSLWWFLVIPTLFALSFIDLFTKVWFGITILISLFLFSSIGSSGLPVSFAIWKPDAWLNLREIRGLEMTEFEWFHWWPFMWLVSLLCLNMFIVTVRKIPFTILTVGVWTIHTGVIVLVLGCTVYFSQKIEGDVLVSRRQVVIEVPGEEPVTMVASPKNMVVVGDTSYTITDINPNWELMSGDDKGKRVYTVTISVDSPTQPFMRQLIAGYPEYTEDILRTDDPQQPMARAKNVLGTALVDDALGMRLEYNTQSTFYVTQSGALYVRELGTDGKPITKWIERPIENLPRFNDYVSDYSLVRSTTIEPIDPLSLAVAPQSKLDPLSGDIIVTDYLRYAFMDSQTTGGGTELFPAAWITLKKGEGVAQELEIYAFNPKLSTADPALMSYKWVTTEEELDAVRSAIEPNLTAIVDGVRIPLAVTTKDTFQNIGETGFSFRIQALQNNLAIANTTVSLAQIELRKEDTSWVRWVFDNSKLNRDVIEGETHDGATFIDDTISMEYTPGATPITLIGGLSEDECILLTALREGDVTETVLRVGETAPITEEVSLTLDSVEEFAQTTTKPTLVPYAQRDPSASNMYSMVGIEIPSGPSSITAWLPYHHYPFESNQESVHRFQFKPTILQLGDGTIIELLFSRRSAKLETPVRLESFEVDSHLGGFTGKTSSILNWRSLVSFEDGIDETIAVSVNDPQNHGELWFFQSQWDPPSANSQGLNYTVLGVGNRYGVFQMLFGCCLTVAGMIWAFYVKPTIKRKRQQAIYNKRAT